MAGKNQKHLKYVFRNLYENVILDLCPAICRQMPRTWQAEVYHEDLGIVALSWECYS